MAYAIRKVDETSQGKVIAFLKRHENYALFLLGNLDVYGCKLTKEPYSGNFKQIAEEGKIVGVFCLTRSGSILIVSEVQAESLFEQVLQSCKEEGIVIKAVLGDWVFCSPFWAFLKKQGIITVEQFIGKQGKEVLYSLDLSQEQVPLQANARLLEVPDYPQWWSLRIAYEKEMNLPRDLTEEEERALFVSKVKRKVVWGVFEKGELVSSLELNAKAKDLGQVGGVYTIPHMRRRGYSKALMLQIMHDAKVLHGIRKLIIFTEENNIPAQRLYESLGSQHIGFFALLFGN